MFNCAPRASLKLKSYALTHSRQRGAQKMTRSSLLRKGLPLAYEVLSGNTSEKTTLKDFLTTIEDQ